MYRTLFYRKLILHFLILITLLSTLSRANSKEANLKLRTNRFLKQLTTTREQGMGGNLVASCEGAESLHGNPAGIAFNSNSRINLSMFRFPETTSYVMFPSTIEELGDEKNLEYRNRAYGIESLRYSTPLIKLGNISLDFVFRHTGKFSRVNSEGKSINEFPESDLVIGFGYAKKFFDTALGVNAKFIRSKALDHEREKTFVRGFVYDIGLIQKAGSLKIGIVWKNLSNGLSHPTNLSPVSRFEIKDSWYIGAAYQYILLQNVELLLEANANPPFKHGIRGNIGSELSYHNWLNLRIGYVRDISDAFILVDESDKESDIEYFQIDSMEKIEGLTFGLGLKTGKLRLDFAFIPVYKLRTESEDFELLLNDKNNYSFSISASYGF